MHWKVPAITITFTAIDNFQKRDFIGNFLKLFVAQLEGSKASQATNIKLFLQQLRLFQPLISRLSCFTANIEFWEELISFIPKFIIHLRSLSESEKKITEVSELVRREHAIANQTVGSLCLWHDPKCIWITDYTWWEEEITFLSSNFILMPAAHLWSDESFPR